MNRFFILALLLLTCIVTDAHADVAPPRLEGCRVLDVGTTCFIEGTTTGVCALVKGNKTCVPHPSPTAATSPLIPTQPPPSPTPPPPTAAPSSTGCTFAGHLSPVHDAGGLFGVLLCVAMAARRRGRQ